MALFNLAAALVGLSFGFSNGISPGPLCFLTISETLKGGFKNGLQVGLSPLITDIPIVLSCVFLYQKLAENSQQFLGLISILGTLFLTFIAYKSFIFTGMSDHNNQTDLTSNAPLIKGITTNFLNPYPYIFWLTVGAPYLQSLAKESVGHWVSFILFFYFGMISAKIIIVFLAAKGRKFLSSQMYIWTMKAIAVVMLYCAYGFANEAYHFLKTS